MGTLERGITVMVFWGERNPQAAQRRRAWYYFMAHYREKLAASTGMGYIWQILAAIVLAGFLAGNVIAALFDAVIGGVVAGMLMMLVAFSWMIHAINCAVKLAMEASAFAEKAIKVTTSQAEIERFFDETYPWLFR